jgi:hypothetical protein
MNRKVPMKPTIGRIVWYRTDGRNGLEYDLPAIITCTQDTHPGDYIVHEPRCASLLDLAEDDDEDPSCDCTPTTKSNPLPVPESDSHVHLTIFTPGGFGSEVTDVSGDLQHGDLGTGRAFVGAHSFTPGSGTYVEWNVPDGNTYVNDTPKPRSWRWPVMSR